MVLQKGYYIVFASFFLLGLSAVNPQDISLIEVTYRVNGKDRSKEIVCLDNQPGLLRNRNGQFLFKSLQSKVRTLRKKKRENPTDVRFKKRLRNTRKLYKTGKVVCQMSSPSPTPSLPTPTPTPTPVNTVTSYFTANGDVTEAGKREFGIPSHLEANMLTGMDLWQSYCFGCHEERQRPTFDMLRSVISKEPMYYDEELLPDDELAHIMAWVSRFRFPE